MALRAMARRVLSERTRAAPRARIRLAAVPDDRDQRDLLFAAAPRVLQVLVRRHAAGFPLRDQGKPLHHAHETAARHRAAAREPLRLGPFPAAREDGAVPLAVPA